VHWCSGAWCSGDFLVTIIQSILFGLLQGLTEFLPISSSGHLAALYHFFGVEEHTLFFTVCLHVGTLVAVFIFFWNDILSLFSTQKRLGLLIVIGSVPTAIMAFFFSGLVERLFAEIRVVGVMLIVTGIWLAIGSIVSNRRNPTSSAHSGLKVWQALLVGISQGVALIPGISRSGATISTALICGTERELSVRYSFLLSIPAILGAFLHQLKEINWSAIYPEFTFFTLLIGTIVAMLTGLVSLRVLSKITIKGKLHYFTPYCFAIGLFLFLFGN